MGCIGCPMSSNRVQELERYPKYKEMYIRAFDRMIDEQIRGGYKVFIGKLPESQTGDNLLKNGVTTDSDGERTYKWWIDRW